MTQKLDNSSKLDAYGRDDAERTLELSPEAMEAVCNEVDAGKHQTIDDALQYLITRGCAELKRTRESAAKSAEAKKVKATRDSLNVLIGSDPKLANNPDFLAMMLKQLGITLPHTLVQPDEKAA